MNTVTTPVMCDYEQEIAARAEALYAMDGSSRKAVIESIERKEGFSVANDIKDALRLIFERAHP